MNIERILFFMTIGFLWNSIGCGGCDDRGVSDDWDLGAPSGVADSGASAPNVLDAAEVSKGGDADGSSLPVDVLIRMPPR